MIYCILLLQFIAFPFLPFITIIPLLQLYYIIITIRNLGIFITIYYHLLQMVFFIYYYLFHSFHSLPGQLGDDILPFASSASLKFSSSDCLLVIFTLSQCFKTATYDQQAKQMPRLLR